MICSSGKHINVKSFNFGRLMSVLLTAEVLLILKLLSSLMILPPPFAIIVSILLQFTTSITSRFCRFGSTPAGNSSFILGHPNIFFFGFKETPPPGKRTLWAQVSE
jgi:hypothetical protein